MKWYLPVTIAVLALFAMGDVTAQGNPTTCRARTLDLRALKEVGTFDTALGVQLYRSETRVKDSSITGTK